MKNTFSLENFGANFFLITSRKKKPANIYNSAAPIDIDVRMINTPHHLPKTKPENIAIGVTNPKNNTQIIEKTKKIIVRNKKFSLLYFRIMSLFSLINS